MHFKTIHIVLFLMILTLALAACQKDADTQQHIEASIDASHPDSTLYRLRLTEQVAMRLKIEKVPVGEHRSESSGTKLKVIPKSAVLTDPNGNTWIYTNPTPGLYVRQHVRFDKIDGDSAFFTAGPPAGTDVVSVGAENLFLKEIGVIR